MVLARKPIHPGEILTDELAELGMSAASLARTIDISASRVRRVLNGSRAISADMALRLGYWFGTGPELWMNLQKHYELRLAEQEVGEKIRERITPRTA